MKNKILIQNIFIATVCLFASLSSFAATKVTSIEVVGNQRVEKSTIINYLGFEIGDNFDEVVKSDAVKNLYATSLFEDISIKSDAGKITINVKENPLVSRVQFTGNTKVKTSMLIDEVYTTAGDSLKRSRLAADIEKVKEIYKRSGRFTVGVDARVEPQENNRVKVVFQINEGPKTGVKRIVFSGNNNYKDSELRTVVMTKVSRWFRFLETNDTYDPDRIELDKYLLKQFYNSVGYADFRVLSVTADLDTTREGFVITYSVDEGEKYKFGKVDFENKLPNVSDEEIKRFIKHERGNTFNLKKMEKLADTISDYLAGKGYPQVEVYPDIDINRNDKIANVKIVVDHAKRIFINKINIQGNLKTEDTVIRRQLKIAEGDLYNSAKIERGEQNIRNLDYFGKFNLGLSPTKNADRYDINIDVEEKSTSSIGSELGYNTSGGMFGRLTFLEKNLVGTGRYLNAGVMAGKKHTKYYMGITDPYFLDRDLSMSVNAYRNQSGKKSGFTNGEQNYSLSSTGADLSLGYDITEDLFHSVNYSLKQDVLRSGGASASRFITEQMGTFVTSAIGHTLSYDRLDSRILPKNGYNISASQEYAGIGGDTGYLKNELEAKLYKSFYENKYTLVFKASGGDIRGMNGKNVRIPERFNLGDATLRGFDFGGIGPRDKLTKEGLGGQKYYSLSSELSFPVGLPEEFNVTGALFVDAGALWDVDSKAASTQGFYNDKSLRSSWGFGFLWVTKIAPIRVDWGFPISKKHYDETRRFHIRFSTSL